MRIVIIDNKLTKTKYINEAVIRDFNKRAVLFRQSWKDVQGSRVKKYNWNINGENMKHRVENSPCFFFFKMFSFPQQIGIDVPSYLTGKIYQNFGTSMM